MMLQRPQAPQPHAHRPIPTPTPTPHPTKKYQPTTEKVDTTDVTMMIRWITSKSSRLPKHDQLGQLNTYHPICWKDDKKVMEST